MARPSRFAATGFVVILTGILGTAAGAQPRGQGTMLVRQSIDCSGTGNASTVHFPFSVLFTGFDPGVTGEVTAFTQPGGVEVGHRTVTVDDQGNRCELVDGTVPPGQHKILYDFGSGTGKKKVIRLVSEPTPTPTPTATATPTTGPTPTGSAAPTTGPTPTGSAAPTTGATPTGTVSPSMSPPSTDVEGRIRFRPVRNRSVLAHTCANLTGAVTLAVALLAAGAGLVALSRRLARPL